jgi:hypothetical protein
VATAAPSHIPLWVTVKYRGTPVDVADPRFVNLGFTDSSLVDAAFYDAANAYMIIVLNGTAYHYCGTPPALWAGFGTAGSLGKYYGSQIKDRFDCRTGFVPGY